MPDQTFAPVPRPTLAQRLNAWWRRRKRIRAWNNTPPERQMAIWLECIDQTPALREQWQRALRVKGFDRVVGGKK